MGPHALSPTGLSVAMVLGSHIIEEADLPEEESRKLPPRVVNVPSFGSVEEPPKRRATGGSTSGVTPYAGSGRGATPTTAGGLLGEEEGGGGAALADEAEPHTRRRAGRDARADERRRHARQVAEEVPDARGVGGEQERREGEEVREE